MKLSMILCSTLVAAKLTDRPPLPWQIKEMREQNSRLARRQSATPNPQTMQVPIDHFKNDSIYEPHVDDSFAMRWWFDPTNYKPGGPVIVFHTGESSSDESIGLQTGLIQTLAQETGGMAAMTEHRYYGDSQPFDDLSTDHLRFLRTEQALADRAFWSQNVVFPGFESQDLSSNATAHIAVGGSYGGAFVSLLRKLYPDVVYGAIASSSVPQAIYDYWHFYDAIIAGAPQDCIKAQQALVGVIDNVLMKGSSDDAANLKDAFGLGDLTNDKDFARVTTTGNIDSWADVRYDYPVDDYAFSKYCDIITSPHVLFPTSTDVQDAVAALVNSSSSSTTATSMQNLIGFINQTQIVKCNGTDLNDCLSVYNTAAYQQDDLSTSDFRSWDYQICTEWGFWQSAASMPESELAITSRLLDAAFESISCSQAFNITTPADTDRINRFGGYNLTYPRLAQIDGEVDPWRAAGPHAFAEGAAQRRNSTDEPFILIPNATHTWDLASDVELGVNDTYPPQQVQDTIAQEVEFVKAWLKDYNSSAHGTGTVIGNQSSDGVKGGKKSAAVRGVMAGSLVWTVGVASLVGMSGAVVL